MKKRNNELKLLISECLHERHDSHLIEQLLTQFPTTAELMDITEQQLISIQGFGIGNTRKLLALLKLAKILLLQLSNKQQYAVLKKMHLIGLNLD